MKRVLTISAIIVSLSTFASDHPLRKVALGHVSFLNSSEDVASYCSCAQDSKEEICLETEYELNQYLLQHEEEVTQIWRELQKDVPSKERVTMRRVQIPKKLTLEKSETSLGRKPEPFLAQELTPLEGEDIQAYVQRVKSVIPCNQNSAKQLLRTSDFFNDDFWYTPWRSQKYVIVMNIELGFHKPDDQFSGEGMTFLDHAIQQKDEEMIFYLWEKGARKTKERDKLNYGSLGEIMRRSANKKSLEVLKELYAYNFEDSYWVRLRRCYDWANDYKWARDLSPELVKAKAEILICLHEDIFGNIKPRHCITQSDIRKVSHNDTPGLMALEAYVRLFSSSDEECPRRDHCIIS